MGKQCDHSDAADLVSQDFLGTAIARIYACAVDQSLWTDTVRHIRDTLDTAFVSLQFITFPDSHPKRAPETPMFRTEWAQGRLEALQRSIPGIPNIDTMCDSEIDVPMSQMSAMEEAEFRACELYREWVKPQGLRDTLNINIIKRGIMAAVLSSPALRDRALLIPDLLDEQNAQVEILRPTLDQLAVAVLLIGPDGRLAHGIGPGELSGRAKRCCLVAMSSHLPDACQSQTAGFFGCPSDRLLTAVARACSGNDPDLWPWGNNIALPGRSSRNAVAYVLPLGKSERRNSEQQL